MLDEFLGAPEAFIPQRMQLAPVDRTGGQLDAIGSENLL
jgi:hypothetical protein